MNRLLISGVLGALALVGATAARAEQWVDYTPETGLWDINAIDVDPNHIDDYLVGLKKSQVPFFEIMKKRGLIDAYKFVVRNGYAKGSPSVLIMVHYTSMAALTPDKARDQAIEKEVRAGFSKEQGEAAVAGYEKYRTFIDNGQWTEVTMTK
jgi:hypothetical protein